jgi:glycosyltransferase involved in cell wall biosynthesis
MRLRPEIIDQPAPKSSSRDLTLPLASVVIVNLNQGHYLRDCIHSVLNQTYNNIEIILQDGGSTDGSVAILKDYSQIDVVSEPDFSSGHAFAKGVKRAKGEFVFFLNSSDGFYSENWIQNAVFELRKSNDVSMVTGSVIGVDSDSTLNSYTWPSTSCNLLSPKTNFYSWLFDGFGFTPITFGIKTEVFRYCSGTVEQFSNPANPYPFDFFWYFSEKFFSNGFISLRTSEVSSFVRIHSDRVDDSLYLARQLEQLNEFIIRFRRRLLLGFSKYRFVDSGGMPINNGEIKKSEIWKYYIQAKIKHLTGKQFSLGNSGKI